MPSCRPSRLTPRGPPPRGGALPRRRRVGQAGAGGPRLDPRARRAPSRPTARACSPSSPSPPCRSSSASSRRAAPGSAASASSGCRGTPRSRTSSSPPPAAPRSTSRRRPRPRSSPAGRPGLAHLQGARSRSASRTGSPRSSRRCPASARATRAPARCRSSAASPAGGRSSCSTTAACERRAPRRAVGVVPESLRARERRGRARTGLGRLRLRRAGRRGPREDADAGARRLRCEVPALGRYRRLARVVGRDRVERAGRTDRVHGQRLPEEPARLRVARRHAGQLGGSRPWLLRPLAGAGRIDAPLGRLSGGRGSRHGQAPGRPPDDADLLPLRGLLPLHARPGRSRRHRLLVARAARVLRLLRHRHGTPARAERDDDASQLDLRRRRERLLRERLLAAARSWSRWGFGWAST